MMKHVQSDLREDGISAKKKKDFCQLKNEKFVEIKIR